MDLPSPMASEPFIILSLLHDSMNILPQLETIINFNSVQGNKGEH